MKVSRLALLAVAALALPTLVHAQPATSLTAVNSFHFDGVKNTSVSLNGYGIGPYMANATVQAPFDMFCIDFDNHAQNDWSARVIHFSDIYSDAATGSGSSARVAAIAALQPEGPALTQSQMQARLRTAAYLTNQFSVQDPSNWAAIHGEIWSIFSTSSQVSAFSAQRDLDIANASIGGNSDWDNYDMIIDNKAFGEGGCSRSACNQTFIVPGSAGGRIVTTPEPGTYVLMGAGLLALGVAGRRRRRTA